MVRRHGKLVCILLAGALGALTALIFPVWLIAGCLAICLISLCICLLCGF